MPEGDLAAAVRAVTARAERYEQHHDRDAVLGLGVLPAAAPLWRAAMSPQGTSFEAMHALARLHWARCQAESPSDGSDELYASLLLYSRIGNLDRGVVPDEVMRLLSGGPIVNHHFLGPEQWGRRAIALLKTQRYTDDPVELDRAVDLFTATVTAYPPEHRLWPGDMANLVLALRMRFERRRDNADLERAVSRGRAALRERPTGSGLVNLLDNLSGALAVRAEETGNPVDATEAVQLSAQALRGATSPPELRRSCESGLVTALLMRFELTGDVGDVDRAVLHARAVMAASPDTDPAGTQYRANLGSALLRQFEATRRPELLREAVASMTAAVKTAGPKHVFRPLALSGLGRVLHARYLLTGDAQDLDDAVAVTESALRVERERGQPHPQSLNTHGIVLRALADVTRERNHLDAAVDAHREALRLTTPEDPQRAMYASNLGNALLYRHEGGPYPLAVSFGTTHLDSERNPRLPREIEEGLNALVRELGDDASADLAEASEAHRLAVHATGQHRPQRAGYLNNWGHSVHARYRATRQHADGQQAVALFRRARHATPPYDPVHTHSTHSLAAALLDLGDEHTQEALTLWQEVASEPSAPQSSRVEAAASWGRVAAERGQWHTALNGYAAAIALLPSLASLGVDREVREQALARWSGLAAEAASCAIAVGDAERALELLEEGRGVLWSQLLDVRGDMDPLRAAAPDIADRLAEVEASLDTSRGPQVVPEPEADGEARWWARAANQRLVWADEQEDLLSRARELPGLADFRRPVAAARLRQGAAVGPVVLVVVSRWRADALIVTQAATSVVPLPALDLIGTVERVVRYVMALERYEGGRRNATARVALNLMVNSTLDWLWGAVAEPVLTALGHTAAPAPGEPWPRLWWCPTGPLALLPLHAAARAAPDEFGASPQATGDAVVDRVVSSYTPTLRALIESRAARSPADLPARLLAVGMPDTPGLEPLPQVDGELAALRELFPAVTELRGTPATRQAVREALRGHPWTHLSCHGGQNLAHPSRGGIVLSDGTLTIADLHADRFGQGEFAFLSACRTAMGGVTVPDEVITMASALQYAGWRHVIGTLWPVGADTAARLCTGLYEDLTCAGGFDPESAAYALHDAVRKMRAKNPQQPVRWAAFTHFGA
ncbi:CHAT domain-containing protein [Streptomyces sp. NPDC051453]|uniref:CHAT domain-containing protein n=1 Tax=Streptomyces sp. NPDC051453 TaxID=3154941 RepID=UPI003419C237